MINIVPMAQAWPLTPTSVAETLSTRTGADGQPIPQWQLDAVQPWSTNGYVSKFWIPQSEEKPTLNQQYWAVFTRRSQPNTGKTGDMAWDYNWRIVDGGWGKSQEEATAVATQLNSSMPATAPLPVNTGGAQQPQQPMGKSPYTKDELIVRQVAGKIAGGMIEKQVIMPENFAEWLELYYNIMMGYDAGGEQDDTE